MRKKRKRRGRAEGGKIYLYGPVTHASHKREWVWANQGADAEVLVRSGKSLLRSSCSSIFTEYEYQYQYEHGYSTVDTELVLCTPLLQVLVLVHCKCDRIFPKPHSTHCEIPFDETRPHFVR
jgi:hypothetical protein